LTHTKRANAAVFLVKRKQESPRKFRQKLWEEIFLTHDVGENELVDYERCNGDRTLACAADIRVPRNSRRPACLHGRRVGAKRERERFVRQLALNRDLPECVSRLLMFLERQKQVKFNATCTGHIEALFQIDTLPISGRDRESASLPLVNIAVLRL